MLRAGVLTALIIHEQAFDAHDHSGGDQRVRRHVGNEYSFGVVADFTNTKNTIEALERAYPMRALRYRLRSGSGGAGLGQGGEGIERDLEMLEDVTVSVITERRVSQPRGLWGGEPRAVGRTGSSLVATSQGHSACSTSAPSR